MPSANPKRGFQSVSVEITYLRRWEDMVDDLVQVLSESDLWDRKFLLSVSMPRNGALHGAEACGCGIPTHDQRLKQLDSPFGPTRRFQQAIT